MATPGLDPFCNHHRSKTIHQEEPMRSMNRVFLLGHLGQNPEVKLSQNGKPYTRLSLATNRVWTNAEDERQEKSDWHSVFVWGPLAEQCCHSLRKGSLVFVEGSLTYWKVAKTTNGTQYMNAIHGHEVRFLSSNKSPETAPLEPMSIEGAPENLDNFSEPRNHNAVAHPA
jgi:single-strand DNA-binding protein